MDHEELGFFWLHSLDPTSLSWQFHQQLPIFHNETPPNTTYNFKEVGQKGKQEPRFLFDIKT
jgi:hypothetical protein